MVAGLKGRNGGNPPVKALQQVLSDLPNAAHRSTRSPGTGGLPKGDRAIQGGSVQRHIGAGFRRCGNTKIERHLVSSLGGKHLVMGRDGGPWSSA